MKHMSVIETVTKLTDLISYIEDERQFFDGLISYDELDAMKNANEYLKKLHDLFE